jgi:hypothetical protein
LRGGVWLKVARDLGCKKILGLDAHENYEILRIPVENYVATNLNEEIGTYGFFDLLICMEVAEHLALDRSRSLISDLCKHSDVILFSAAIPMQGGFGHVNEQWQSYWAKLFIEENFLPFDLVRPLVWHNPKVEIWYRQNVLVFVRNTALERYGLKYNGTNLNMLDVVHPEYFIYAKTGSYVKVTHKSTS